MDAPERRLNPADAQECAANSQGRCTGFFCVDQSGQAIAVPMRRLVGRRVFALVALKNLQCRHIFSNSIIACALRLRLFAAKCNPLRHYFLSRNAGAVPIVRFHSAKYLACILLWISVNNVICNAIEYNADVAPARKLFAAAHNTGVENLALSITSSMNNRESTIRRSFQKTCLIHLDLRLSGKASY